jgi:hypothetical protein
VNGNVEPANDEHGVAPALVNLVFSFSVMNPHAVVWLFMQYCTEQLIAT